MARKPTPLPDLDPALVQKLYMPTLSERADNRGRALLVVTAVALIAAASGLYVML